MSLTPDEMEEVFEATQRHIAEMEVVRVKEALWKASLWEVRMKFGALDESLFEAAATVLQEEVKAGMVANPGFAGPLQDAIGEFRSEARRLFCAHE